MGKRLSAAEYTAKHSRRLKGALDDIRSGVDATAEAPSAAAVAKQDKMLSNLTNAVENGRWARRLGEYSLADWKADMKTKGVQRISSGIDNAAPKVTKFAQSLLSHAYSVSDEVRGMPDMTLEDNIARATAAIRRMSEFKYK